MTEEKKSPLKTVKDVYFVYTSTSRPQKQLNKDNKPALSKHPLEFHGWEVKILVTETIFKAMKRAFKGAKNFPNVKEYTPEEVMKANLLGDDGVEPDEDMVLIKFTQSCLYGPEGNRRDARPVTQIGVKGKVQDRNGLTIDKDTSIGNGSKGHLQFNPVSNDYGLYLYPTAICITELVEYVQEGGGYDEDAFDLEDLDEEDGFGEEPADKEPEPEDEDFGDPAF